MKKYGIEHFHIELIEETDKPEEREEYWIQQLGTYKHGYNATMGGDGKRYLDYDKIYELYLQGKTINEIAKEYGCDSGYASRILREKYNITKEQIHARYINKICVPIAMIDKNTNKIIKIFSTMSEAEAFLDNNIAHRHIDKVCKGIRKTAYGYKWKKIKE